MSEIVRPDAARRAALIYAEARSQIEPRLWRAALGGLGNRDTGSAGGGSPVGLKSFDLAALVGLADAPAAPSPPPRRPVADGAAPAAVAGLGANAAYAPTIADAARRTGVPAAALASIIDAEAGKDATGAWRTAARNPRSSASGLGQFLSGTWQAEAQRVGTWLNAVARRNGWIGDRGTVRAGMAAPLLALRDDAAASINATADYARHSLDRLAAAGAAVGTSVDEVARAAYLGHNLGLGDAARFLKGGLDDRRAARLLDAQVGVRGADARIAAAGGPAAAHRGWLLDFMTRHVNASRFLSRPV